MKIAVSKKKFEKFLRETMMNPGVGWQSTTELSDSPATVSAVVDPSAAVTDPGNQNFKPSNRKELRTALSDMINDVSDDCVEDIYDAMKGAIEKTEEDKDMENDKKVEETIRLAIRKIIKEANPKFKDIPVGTVTNPRGITPTKYPAGMSGGEASRSFEKREANLGKAFQKMDTDPDTAEMLRTNEPAAGRERKNVMQTDVGGASFKQIAQELGYASESGAKQAAEKAMTKVQFASGMDPDQLQIVVLTAMSDYIDFLNKSGELTPADVQLMKDHPNIVSELDGFREFLDKYMKRQMKGKGME